MSYNLSQTTFGGQGNVTSINFNGICPNSVWDDSLFFDESKIWFDNSIGTPVYSRRLI